MTLIAIEDGLEPDIAVGIGNLRAVGQVPLDQPAIGLCGFHTRMVSEVVLDLVVIPVARGDRDAASAICSEKMGRH